MAGGGLIETICLLVGGSDAMRMWMVALWTVSACLGVSNLLAQKSDQEVQKEQREKWSKFYLKMAKSYEISVQDEKEDVALELVATPVLRWQNPIRPETHGECFVWIRDGRPEAVASLFSYPRNGFRRVAHAFNSISEGTLTADRNDRQFWRVPAHQSVKMIPVPMSPNVAAKPTLRLAQMRSIMRGFTAFVGGGGVEEKRELRLLTTPLYRYPQSDSSQRDGALFAFAMGTDPEVLLLIESREEDSMRKWYFLPMRHTYISLQVLFKGNEVWSYERGDPMATYLSQHGIDRQPEILP